MTFLSLGILVFAFGASLLKGRPFGIKVLKVIFIIAIIAVFSLLIYYSYQQYVAWQSVEPSKFLLPPYQAIDYFVKYVGARFFAPYLISLIAAILFLFAAKRLNKKYEERFFEPEELWFGALAIFLVGHPGWLFYFTSLILIYFLIHIFSFLISHFSSFRISLYYLWLPLAIFVILINKWLVELEVWKLLKI
ncbi:MAG: hypothetical protein AAB504_00425 [Patescibacteria group bacterium]